jgi:hypothetical protein
LDFGLLKIKFFLISVFVIAALLANVPGFALSQSKVAGAKTQSKKAQAPSKSRAEKKKAKANEVSGSKEMVKATQEYKAAIDAEIASREARLKQLLENAHLEEKKRLYQDGLITKEEIEREEKPIALARAELDIAKQKIVQADNTLAEAKAMEALTKLPPIKVGAYLSTAALIRYNGPSAWTLTNIAKVDSFFTAQFGHALPVSAFGQTATHDRLGFDHRNSVDVAVHPDSSEGQALMNYLRGAGIPFLAFRQAVPGTATGAHIHIGYPSHRIQVK